MGPEPFEMCHLARRLDELIETRKLISNPTGIAAVGNFSIPLVLHQTNLPGRQVTSKSFDYTLNIEVLPAAPPEFLDFQSNTQLNLTQSSGLQFFDAPPFNDPDGLLTDVAVSYNISAIESFAFTRTLDTLPLKTFQIVFDTDREAIEGTYSVEITLSDLALHSTSYNLIVNVLPDPSNTPPYFEDEWFDD